MRQAVWEVTYRCNMRCKHCGSGCGEPLNDELTTDEALRLCDEMGRLEVRLVTLSGGEPFMRPDWPVIAKRLKQNGVRVNCISNGWFISAPLIEEAKGSGIINIGVSVDGLKETHDLLRRRGSFDRAMSSLALMERHDMPTVACTAVNKKNIQELAQVKRYLIERGVEQWQFQIAVPMGNMSHHPELVISPNDLVTVLDFCYDTMKEGRITVCLADCIGYYSIKGREIGRYADGEADGIWRGCPAGKRVVGIRANGDISGCLSIREDSFIEGNVRDASLVEIWSRPGAFAWNRGLAKETLTGFCSTCQYGAICLGGCSSTKLAMHHCITHNDYCLYNVIAKQKDIEIMEGD